MSSYKKIVISIILVIVLTIACASGVNKNSNTSKSNNKISNIKNFPNENLYVLIALEYEKVKDLNSAINYFNILFKKTNNYEYFNKKIQLHFLLKQYNQIVRLMNDDIIENVKNTSYEISVLKIYTYSLMKTEDYDKAIKYLQKLVTIMPEDKKTEIMEVLAGVYFEKKDYKKSYKIFKEINKIKFDQKILITLSEIKFYYLDQKEEGIKILEDYLENNSGEMIVIAKLIKFYEGDMDKILFMLKKQYYSNKLSTNDKQSKYLKYFIVEVLAKKDINKAIKFLEDNKEESILLIELYRNSNNYQKAIKLSKKLYKKTNNLIYLAQEAICIFEKEKNKELILKDVVKKLTKVTQGIKNDFYDNYLAYILIDYNLDIEKGLELVNRALKIKKDDISYLDTLAWGEYKNKNYKEAYKIMKKIIDKIGLENKEIKFHWDEIKKQIKN